MRKPGKLWVDMQYKLVPDIIALGHCFEKINNVATIISVHVDDEDAVANVDKDDALVFSLVSKVVVLVSFNMGLKLVWVIVGWRGWSTVTMREGEDEGKKLVELIGGRWSSLDLGARPVTGKATD